MADSRTAPERRGRALMGVVAASALVYPLVGCALHLVFAQLITVDVGAVVLWLALGVVCSVAFVAAVRWGAGRRVLSRWLILGVAPPVLFELWLAWPQLAL
jgi:hypothetical protein